MASAERRKDKSIAVLPFVNMSSDANQEYFCDGMAEELIDALSKISGLLVVARTSAFAFKGQNIDVREIGKKLNVNTVLEGSVRKAGNRLRITAQLINVADGYHLWSERYDRELEDVFAIQEEISLAIVESLKVKLLDDEKSRVLKRHTENLEAHSLYLKGRQAWNMLRNAKAIEYYKQAIEQDPLYALAYVGIADSLHLEAGHTVSPPTEIFAEAKEAATKALAIDDTLGEAYAALGFISMLLGWDWVTAENQFTRAKELAPGNGWALEGYAHYLLNMGRTYEAIAEYHKAQTIDPLFTDIEVIYWSAGRYDEAIEYCGKMLEMFPNRIVAIRVLGQSYTCKKMFEQAIAAFQKALSIDSEDLDSLSWLGCTLALSGKSEEALRMLDRIKKLSVRGYSGRFSRALINIGLNKIDKAFKHLERAISDKEWNFTYYLPKLTNHQIFDSFTSDSRYQELLRRMNL